MLLLISFVCFHLAQATGDLPSTEPQVQQRYSGRYEYPPHGRCFHSFDQTAYTPMYVPQESSFFYAQQPIIFPPRVTYLHFYNGRWEESICHLECYFDPLSLGPNNIAFFQINPESFMRLTIGYDAYNKILEIEEWIRNLENKSIHENSRPQFKSIAYKILNLIQIENCLWNEYVIYDDDYITPVPILGEEWCNILVSCQQKLVSKLEQFHAAAAKKRKLPDLCCEIGEIWRDYKEKSLTLETLNSKAIRDIEAYRQDSPALMNDPIIMHQLEYRKRYQRYKYWLRCVLG